MKQLSIRIPDEIKESLEKVASADQRSVSFIVKEAITQYLEKIEKLNKEK